MIIQLSLPPKPKVSEIYSASLLITWGLDHNLTVFQNPRTLNTYLSNQFPSSVLSQKLNHPTDFEISLDPSLEVKPEHLSRKVFDPDLNLTVWGHASQTQVLDRLSLQWKTPSFSFQRILCCSSQTKVENFPPDLGPDDLLLYEEGTPLNLLVHQSQSKNCLCLPEVSLNDVRTQKLEGRNWLTTAPVRKDGLLFIYQRLFSNFQASSAIVS